MKRITSPLLTLAVLIALWWIATAFGGVPNYLLPRPSQVGVALWRGYGEGDLWPHLAYTLQSLLLGYVLGAILAVALAVLVVESPPVERSLMPLVVAFQSMPKVAVAPLIIVWFGFGIASKVVLVALICFFPTFINLIAGLRSADPNMLDLMRTVGASRWRVLVEVKLPSAADALFSGLQIAVVLGLIGAIVGEFIASTRGLGFVIQSAATQLDLGVLFAALIGLAVIGLIGTQLLQLLRRRVIFWQRTTDPAALVEVS